MQKSFQKVLNGYHAFREKYATGDNSIMKQLADHGQKPQIMVIACCDSRVDPALIMQCDPGDLFTVRNVANIIPPCEADFKHHGTSAALEFGVCYLNVKHIIVLGHSNCGGLDALINNTSLHQDDFISSWVEQIAHDDSREKDTSTLCKRALIDSYNNCLSFPWIKERIDNNQLAVHLWYFDIEKAEISTYSFGDEKYTPLK